MGHHRHHDVQLENAGLTSDRDRQIVADNLRDSHQHRFSNNRIYLAWHDRRTWLHFGKMDFADATSGARCEPPNVVCDFRQTDSDGFQGATVYDNRILPSLRLTVIFVLATFQASD